MGGAALYSLDWRFSPDVRCFHGVFSAFFDTVHIGILAYLPVSNFAYVIIDPPLYNLILREIMIEKNLSIELLKFNDCPSWHEVLKDLETTQEEVGKLILNTHWHN